MDRLTTKDDNICSVSEMHCYEAVGDCFCGEAIDRLAAYEDTGLTPEEIHGLCEMDKRSRMSQMLRWEQAEAEGRLIMLPCKVGDTVYWVTESGDCDNCEYYNGITNMDDWECCASECPQTIIEIVFQLHKFDLLGKTVFLTREEAEAALKGGKQDGAD